MSSRIIIDGNAIYEVDEECLRKKKKRSRKRNTKSNGRSAKTKHKKGGDIICPASGLSERIRSEFRN